MTAISLGKNGGKYSAAESLRRNTRPIEAPLFCATACLFSQLPLFLLFAPPELFATFFIPLGGGAVAPTHD